MTKANLSSKIDIYTSNSYIILKNLLDENKVVFGIFSIIACKKQSAKKESGSYLEISDLHFYDVWKLRNSKT